MHYRQARLFPVLAIIVAATGAAWSQFTASSVRAPAMSLFHVTGDVQVRPPDGPWQPATSGAQVPADADVRTGTDGELLATLAVPGVAGAADELRVGPMTALRVQSSVKDNWYESHLLVTSGAFTVGLDPNGGPRGLVVRTPMGAARATSGVLSVRHVDRPRPESTIGVVEGAAEVTPLRGRGLATEVWAGEQVTATPRGLGPVVSLAAEPTDTLPGAGDTMPPQPAWEPPPPQPSEPPRRIGEAAPGWETPSWDTQDATPLGEPGKLDTPLLIAILTDELGADKRPLGPKAAFAADVEMLHLYVHTNQEPPDRRLTITWSRNGKDVDRLVAQMGANRSIVTSVYSRKRPTLPPGDWCVTLTVGRTVVGSIPFRVGG